ncbi:MAG: tetratricopeptide repeat protein [Chloroflexota bacterium]
MGSPKPPSPNRFNECLRNTLEHIGDHNWLVKNSPLTSLFFAGAHEPKKRQPQIMLTGQEDLDRHLRTIWHDWENCTKSPLQALIWETVCHLSPETKDQTQAILLLTYFDHEHPKQSQVIKRLAVGRSTYYRYLERAIDSLGRLITEAARPALHLERPQPSPLIGRKEQKSHLLKGIRAGRVLHVVGGSGLGKTALAAAVADEWPNSVFWYTFRPGLADHFENLLFAVAYFLHEQGASGLWLHLTTNSELTTPSRAMMVIRDHLNALKEQPPLFCFDEVDLLLPDTLNDSEEYSLLRGFLDEWATSERSGSPLLMVGQKLLMEPDMGCLVTAEPFTLSELTRLLKSRGQELSQRECNHLLQLTRGNPLLLNLVVLLYQSNPLLLDSVERLASPLTLGWFLKRLVQHLSLKEQVVLHELSIFPDNAPMNGWQRTKKQLATLLDLGLATKLGVDNVALHPALRNLVYQQLPHTRRVELHLAAGNLLAERGCFTAAAWHYIQGEQPEMGIWTWYSHQQQEVDQGFGSAALDLFAPLAHEKLSRNDDQRALALLLTPLLKRAGRYKEGLDLLEQVYWSKASVSGIMAYDMKGELLAEDGRIEQSLQTFRKGLESLRHLRSTQEVEFHLQIGRRLFARLGDLEKARHEALEARLSLDVHQGRLAEVTGHYESARNHYTNALQLAEGTTDIKRLALIHQGLGFLEAHLANVDAAVKHANETRRLFELLGDQILSVGTPNSILSVAYLVNRQYADAVEPAETALTFFRNLNHVYWIAANETYLAEAWLYLGDIEKSEAYAQSALRHEEIMFRPYCLFILGHVRRIQHRFEESEAYCRDAISTGEELEEPSAIAPAWSALGETLRDWGKVEEAQMALEQALAIWQRLNNQLEIKHTQDLLASLAQNEKGF